MKTPTGDQALIKRMNTAIVLESVLQGARSLARTFPP